MALVTELVEYLTSPEAELRSVRELAILPSHREAYGDSSLVQDPYLKVSLEAIARGRRMPVVPEMRVIWDAMRPEMQNVMNGIKTPAEAARAMQAAAVAQIAAMKK